MKSVLEKTRQSLEAALRYNPDSTELMASLAEVYVRLGRFDTQTLELCDRVLARRGDHPLLSQAQCVALLIEQSRELESSLERGDTPPPLDAISEPLSMLEDYLNQSGESPEAWRAWTRLQLLAGDLGKACDGLKRLRHLGVEDLDEGLECSLHHATNRADLDADAARALGEIHTLLSSPEESLERLESMYDRGQSCLGPTLLQLYLDRYTPDRLTEMDPTVRNRLFPLLIEHADQKTAGQWLRKATLHGCEVSLYTRDYARALMADDQLDEAFTILQRATLDAAVRELLNKIADRYEALDEVDKAVSVLRFLNEHAYDEHQIYRESELEREADLSIAEMQLKNDRPGEALMKFISALTRSHKADPEILERIEDLLADHPASDVAPRLHLGRYFRRLGDLPKAIAYLDHAHEAEPGNREVLRELEELYEEVLDDHPDMVRLRLELARVCLESGKASRALEAARLAAGHEAFAEEAAHLIARAHVQAGALEDALGAFRDLTLDGEDLEALYQLHTLFMQRQNPTDAMRALEMIQRIDSGYRDVESRVRQVRDQISRQQAEAREDPTEAFEGAPAPRRADNELADLAAGRYQHMERLGSGGMGVVHKALDTRTDQIVAIKILRDGLSGSNKALDRFFREARIAATLNHRNIVKIFDYNISNLSGQSYIVMEYVDGPSLREFVDRQFEHSISIGLDYVAEMLYYAVQIAEALDAVHNKGIVHRDIKPDNVMITMLGEVKITDFGIVHIEEATFTHTGAMLGTPRYMAPEQVTGNRVDGRSDIYSVGILLYEELVGSPPFLTGDVSYQQVHNRPVPPREINAVIPQSCEDAIMKCLEKDPEDRYQSAQDLKRDLNRILEDLGGCDKYARATCTELSTVVGRDEDLD